MPWFAGQNLGQAARQSRLACEALDGTREALFDAFGDVHKLHDRGLLAEGLESIETCRDTMRAVSDTLDALYARLKSPLRLRRDGRIGGERLDEPDERSDWLSLRNAVAESGKSSERLGEVYELLLRTLGAFGRDDNERLYQTLKDVEACRDTMRGLNEALTQILTRLEDMELQVLYGPPSFFDGD